jgi:hypothetical protein
MSKHMPQINYRLVLNNRIWLSSSLYQKLLLMSVVDKIRTDNVIPHTDDKAPDVLHRLLYLFYQQGKPSLHEN